MKLAICKSSSFYGGDGRREAWAPFDERLFLPLFPILPIYQGLCMSVLLKNRKLKRSMSNYDSTAETIINIILGRGKENQQFEEEVNCH
jgi:hypothetical protein